MRREAPAGFPLLGDNFRTVGPWRILEGQGWQRWQARAVTAEIAASDLHGDMIATARLKRELRARRDAGSGGAGDVGRVDAGPADASSRASDRVT